MRVCYCYCDCCCSVRTPYTVTSWPWVNLVENSITGNIYPTQSSPLLPTPPHSSPVQCPLSLISRAARNYLLRDSEVRIDKFFICFGKLHSSRPGRTLGSQTRYLTLRVLFGRFLSEIPPDVTNILYFHFILYLTDFHI